MSGGTTGGDSLEWANWADEHSFVVFFIPMRTSIALPHLSQYGFLRSEPVNWLQNEVTEDGQPLDGHNFVSLRVWRHPETLRFDVGLLVRAFETAFHTAGLDKRLPEDAELPGFSDKESWSTVIEAVTPLLTVKRGNGEPDYESSVSHAFDRCLEHARQLVGAYAIWVRDGRVDLPSRQNIPPTIPIIIRAASDPEDTRSGPGVFLANDGRAALPRPVGTVDEETRHKIDITLHRMGFADPFTRSMEHSSAATRAELFAGDMALAIVETHMASEVLFDALLQALTWDEGMTPADCAGLFDDTLANRIRKHFHTRLGGNWSSSGEQSAISAWETHVRIVRNEIVHGSLYPSETQVHRAGEAYDRLLGFLKERVYAKRSSYPRTALLFLGLPGLRRRGAAELEIRELENAFDEDPVASLFMWCEAVRRERESRFR